MWQNGIVLLLICRWIANLYGCKEKMIFLENTNENHMHTVFVLAQSPNVGIQYNGTWIAGDYSFEGLVLLMPLVCGSVICVLGWCSAQHLLLPLFFYLHCSSEGFLLFLPVVCMPFETTEAFVQTKVMTIASLFCSSFPRCDHSYWSLLSVILRACWLGHSWIQKGFFDTSRLLNLNCPTFRWCPQLKDRACMLSLQDKRRMPPVSILCLSCNVFL